jgi:hypothetical protein
MDVGENDAVAGTAVIGIYLETRKHLEMFANLICDFCGLERKHLRLHLTRAGDNRAVVK